MSTERRKRSGMLIDCADGLHGKVFPCPTCTYDGDEPDGAPVYGFYSESDAGRPMSTERRKRSDIRITPEHVRQVRAGILLMGFALGLVYDRSPGLRSLLESLVPQQATRWRGAFDPEIAHVP